MNDSTATPTEEDSCLSWGFQQRRSRKSACSNIFSGVNIQQLQRLFQTAGHKDAEHRARLVWRGQEDEDDIQHTDGVKGTEETGEEAELAQALVALRICARTKAGLRAEGPSREQKWHGAYHPHMQIKKPFSEYSVMEEDITSVTHDSPFLNGEKMSGNPIKSSWRLGVARHECVRDSERYLRRILH